MLKTKFKLLIVAVLVFLMSACMTTVTSDPVPELPEFVKAPAAKPSRSLQEEWLDRRERGETFKQYIRRVICTEDYDLELGSYRDYQNSYEYWDCANYTRNKA